jgi:nucleotide-binding universal stress UspA family protein
MGFPVGWDGGARSARISPIRVRAAEIHGRVSGSLAVGADTTAGAQVLTPWLEVGVNLWRGHEQPGGRAPPKAQAAACAFGAEGADDREELERNYRAYLIDTVSAIARRLRSRLWTLVAEGDPAAALLQAPRDADLLVLGTRAGRCLPGCCRHPRPGLRRRALPGRPGQRQRVGRGALPGPATVSPVTPVPLTEPAAFPAAAASAGPRR